MPLAIAAAILGGAVVWYALYAKVHVLRESALIRLAGRLVKPDFEDYDLEAELSRIARERDTIVEDRFDQIIGDCPVLDMPPGASREDLFRAVAGELAAAMPLPAETILRLLEARENVSSTVVRPGLAVPHIVDAAAPSLRIVLARSREGIAFEEGEREVRAVFVLAAPPGERNVYLKALVAVAEIAQEPDFDRKWLSAGSPEALREIILAAERRREHPWEGEEA